MIRFSQLEKALNAKLYGNDAEIKHILIDSRTQFDEENSTFIALTGKNHNGHHYIENLYKAGVRKFIISENISILQNAKDTSVLLVNNTLTAFQLLVKIHREQFEYPKVAVTGITGSNAKTIIKTWLTQLTSYQYNVVSSPKSFNSQVGVPLSVWNMNSHHSLAFFEAGISQKNEMRNLKDIIQPDYGIFTNIGDAHQENFKNLIEKIEEKSILFENCKKLIYCKDHKEIDLVLTHKFNKNADKLFTWSTQTNTANIFFKTEKSFGKNTRITLTASKKNYNFFVPFTDRASLENIMHCLAWIVATETKIDDLQNLLTLLNPVSMRLELKEGIYQSTIINDYYNLDINSLKIALDFMSQQQIQNRIVVLSDILQSSFAETELYTKVSELLQLYQVKSFIGIGSKLLNNKNLFKSIPQSYYYESTDVFLKKYSEINFSKSIILIKGARVFGFEKIAETLQQKTHKTILEVNLNAITHNLNYFRTFLDSKTKIMVMVKAFSYGAGTSEIANLLAHNRVDYLGVAYCDEGIELRKTDCQLPIMVMNCSSEDFANLLQYNLEPEIYCFEILKEYLFFVSQSEYDSVNIHLKLDTGMHRLGFEEQELPELVALLKTSKVLKIKSIFSHLSGSDDTVFDNFTHEQIQKFERMCAMITTALDYQPMRHILNSAGIERFANIAQYEIVRLGIGLYGTSALSSDKTMNISTLKTRIAQIKDIHKEETVGYSRKGKLNQQSRIATISIGYADGYNRLLSNGKGKVYLHGKFAPIVGNICMDMTMIDITEIPEAKTGDEVEIFGEHISVNELAMTLNTIPYEILTNVSPRVKKIYYWE